MKAILCIINTLYVFDYALGVTNGIIDKEERKDIMLNLVLLIMHVIVYVALKNI